MSFLINPYAFLAAGGDFESIATVTVGSGGASSITFSDIPGGFQHLQIRVRLLGSGTNDNFSLRLNGDTGNNYASHQLQGNGSAAEAASSTSANRMILMGLIGDSTTAPFASIMDILDYGNTSKNTTVRAFSGNDGNAANTVYRVSVNSGLWVNTSAVTSVTLLTGSSMTWGQHSTAALYGIKAP